MYLRYSLEKQNFIWCSQFFGGMWSEPLELLRMDFSVTKIAKVRKSSSMALSQFAVLHIRVLAFHTRHAATLM